MKNIYFIIALILFSGCYNIDKPNPEFIEYWYKKNEKMSRVEIGKAFLECGAATAFGGSPKGADYNDDIMFYRCMYKAGFSETLHNNVCTDKRLKTYPACSLPWSEIPNRSVAKRLNSPYCKQYPQAQACQRNDHISNEKPAPQQQLKTQDVPISQEDEFLKQLRQQQEKEHFNSLKQMIPKVHK